MFYYKDKNGIWFKFKKKLTASECSEMIIKHFSQEQYIKEINSQSS